MPASRADLRGAAAGPGAPGDLRQGVSRQQEKDQGHSRAGSLSGRDADDDRSRNLCRERHRARHRLAIAPFAGRILRSRQGQDALVRQVAVFRAGDSLPRFLARFRVRSEGLRIRSHRPPSQAAGVGAVAGVGIQQRADARNVLRYQRVHAFARGISAEAGCGTAARRNRQFRYQRR